MAANESALQRLLARACDIRPEEVRATLASFSLVLVLMASYYVLRPVRDAMASDWTDAEVSWLWTFTFFFSAAAVSLYGAAVARFSVKKLVPGVYAFFGLTFALFYVGTQIAEDRTLVDKSFYVWVSLFALFHISVFWSFMSDTFSQPQSKRLFAFIGAGASVGAIGGPAFASLLAGTSSTDAMLLISTVVILAALPLVIWVQHLKSTELHNQTVHASSTDFEYVGGNPFAGFAEFVKNPFLLGIGVFILLYTSISSFVYFELKNLMVDYTREERAQIWAQVDLLVNALTLIIGMFVTGRIATRMGLPFTLASVPMLICVGMLLLMAAPSVAAVIAIQVVRRVGNYAVSRPAREMLFTAVDRETRFKAKPVIDIVVYRGGDMLNAWAFTLLTQGLGLSLGAAAGVGAGIALLWAGTGVALGRSFERREEAAGLSAPSSTQSH
ncbi:MFS transporter [Halioglobus sp. HI00S01]|uniref:NTP/NDP exchange transporter n=1 Tax=Halioglobus sp. HI00S01 TaxID=1822214 RepID=UPI0007C36186|nr:MFS transporter [Halioglobus sp. HI00S01]KZX57146.1 MFS transporter [Halioglobus sp. HI00S01]